MPYICDNSKPKTMIYKQLKRILWDIVPWLLSFWPH